MHDLPPHVREHVRQLAAELGPLPPDRLDAIVELATREESHLFATTDRKERTMSSALTARLDQLEGDDRDLVTRIVGAFDEGWLSVDTARRTFGELRPDRLRAALSALPEPAEV